MTFKTKSQKYVQTKTFKVNVRSSTTKVKLKTFEKKILNIFARLANFGNEI